MGHPPPPSVRAACAALLAELDGSRRRPASKPPSGAEDLSWGRPALTAPEASSSQLMREVLGELLAGDDGPALPGAPEAVRDRVVAVLEDCRRVLREGGEAGADDDEGGAAGPGGEGAAGGAPLRREQQQQQERLEAHRRSLDVHVRALRLARETVARHTSAPAPGNGKGRDDGGAPALTVDTTEEARPDGAGLIAEAARLRLAGEGLPAERAVIDELLSALTAAFAGDVIEGAAARLSSDSKDSGAYVQSPVSLGDGGSASTDGARGRPDGEGPHDPRSSSSLRRPAKKKKKKVTWDLGDSAGGPAPPPRSSSEPGALASFSLSSLSLVDEPAAAADEGGGAAPPPAFRLEHAATLAPPAKSKLVVRGISISPERTTLVAHYADESLAVWHLGTRRLAERFRLGAGAGGGAAAAAAAGAGWLLPGRAKYRVRRVASVSDADALVAVEVERGARPGRRSLELWDWRKKRRVQVLFDEAAAAVGAAGAAGRAPPPWAHNPVRHLCGEIAVWDRPAGTVRKFSQARLLNEHSVAGLLQGRALVDLGRDAGGAAAAGGGGGEAAGAVLALSPRRPYLATATTAATAGGSGGGGGRPERHALLTALDLTAAEEEWQPHGGGGGGGGSAGRRSPGAPALLRRAVTELDGVEEPLDAATDGRHVASLWRRWNALASRSELCLLSWEPGTDRCQVVYPPSDRARARLSPDGRLLAMWDETRQLSILDGREGRVLLANGSEGQGGRIAPLYPTAVAFSDDCAALACGNRDGSIDVFDIRGFQPDLKMNGRGKYSTF